MKLSQRYFGNEFGQLCVNDDRYRSSKFQIDVNEILLNGQLSIFYHHIVVGTYCLHTSYEL